MANNSIGAYAQGGSNEIGAYEYAGIVAASNAISIILYYYLTLMGGNPRDV